MENKDSVVLKSGKQMYCRIGAAFLLGCLAISFFISGLYFEINFVGKPVNDQTVLKFDSFSEGEGGKRRLDAQMMTPEFASENRGANSYYFVFDQLLTPYIVKIQGKLPEEYQKLIDYLYNGQEGELLKPIELTGWPAPIDEKLSRVAAEAYNTIWGEDVIEGTDFTKTFGSYFLDTTKNTSDLVSLQIFLLFLAAVILLIITILVIVRGFDKIHTARRR